MTFIIFGRSLFLTAKWAKATNNRAFYQPPYYDTQDVKYQRQNPFLFIRKKKLLSVSKTAFSRKIVCDHISWFNSIESQIKSACGGCKKSWTYSVYRNAIKCEYMLTESRKMTNDELWINEGNIDVMSTSSIKSEQKKTFSVCFLPADSITLTHFLCVP